LAWAPSIKAAGLVRHPLASARHPLLAPEDVGEVAARVLTEDGHEGAAHTLTGEESLSVAEQAAVIGAAIGRDLAVAEISLDEAEAAMVARGMPPATAAAVRELHGFTREGRTDIVTGTVRELLGRAPRSFRWWCAENAAAFS
ncbi:MAG TPA: hypothetical protein VGF17_22985, partial [Phytomonospora sp.]